MNPQNYRTLKCLVAWIPLLAVPAAGGTFAFVENCVDIVVDNQNPPPIAAPCFGDGFDGGEMPPFAIVHPLGYTGVETDLELKICVSSPQLVGATQVALGLWNALTPTTGNCEGCTLWEEAATTGQQDAPSVALHELGHCAMGLGHINLHEDDRLPIKTRVGRCDADNDGCCQEPTSFTASVNATDVVDGVSPRGDLDDDQLNGCPNIPAFNSAERDTVPKTAGSCVLGVPCPAPAECRPTCPGPDCPLTPMQVQEISWFRIADNNPFAIDATVIDKNSFSRSTSDFPGGHTYTQNANRAVAESLALGDTQGVMYSLQSRGASYSGVAADEVNMVRYGMAGADRDAGTADDYTIRLQYVADCANADIEVMIATLPLTIVGSCNAGVELSFPQAVLKFHYSITETAPRLEVRLSSDLDLGGEFNYGPLLYRSGFENGDLSEWSDVQP